MEKFNKKVSTLVGITIIVIVAVVLFGGVFAYEHFATKKAESNSGVVGQQQSSNGLNLNEMKVNATTYSTAGVYVNDAQKYQISYATGTKLQETLDHNKYCVTLTYKGGYITIASLKDDKSALDSGQAITSCAVIDGLGSGYSPITQSAIVNGKKYNATGFQYQNKANDPYYEYHDTALVFPLTNNITIQYGYNNSSNTAQATDQEYNDTMNVITQMLSSFKFTSSQTSTSNTANQSFLPLMGLNFSLPAGWQVKSVDSSDSNAVVTDSANNQLKMSMSAVNSYQDFGSGKYNVTPIQTGGSIWNEVATDSIVPIGIDLYGSSAGPYYNFVADFGNNKVPTIDQNQIWNMVKNLAPYIGYGTYQFEEFAPPNEDWMYTFNFPESADGHIYGGFLSVDGFQTETRINVTFGYPKNSDSLQIIFDSYGSGNTNQQFKKGDVLLTLTPTVSDNFSIQWGKMQPNLQGSLMGSIFKKISN